MRISTIAALSSLATLISAVPLDKRVLVIHTAYESVTETVDVYTTVTLKAGEQPKVQNAAAPVSTTKHVQHKHKPFRSKASTSTTPAAVQYSAPVPGPPTSTPSPPAPVQSSPAPVVIAPPPPSSTLAPVQSSSAPVVIAPAPVSSPPVPVSSSTTSQPPLPQTSSIPSAPVNAPSSPESDGGSSGGSCGEPGGACSGELTYYDAGLGSCGIVNDGTTEKVFALAHGMMEAQGVANPNDNPLCGKLATIYLDGKEVVAKLVDTCAACNGQSVDLSHAAFDAIGVESVGRYYNVEWHFN